MTSEPLSNSKTVPSLARLLRHSRPRGLFLKYVLTLVSLVVFVLAVTGSLESWIVYQETTTTLTHAQYERATAIAKRIEDTLAEIERQVSWATRASATTIELRRGDYILLLHQVPAIAELAFIDGAGHEQLRVARGSVKIGGDEDYSRDEAFIEGVRQGTWFGPAFFRGRDPYITLSMSHSGYRAGVTIARISVSALSPLVDPSPLGPANHAYVVGPEARVLAASKQSPVETGAALMPLPRVTALLRGAKSQPDMIGEDDAHGQSVIAAVATIDSLHWLVVVEQATAEALRPVRDLLVRLAWLVLLGLALATLAGFILARHMIVPIEALHAGATQFAANRFEHRIAVKTGDELEELASQFNRMADELAGSYARLEQKVEERTRDLARSVRELKALEEIGRALAASLDIDAVIAAIVSRAVELTKADAGAVFDYDNRTKVFRLAEAQGFSDAYRAAAATIAIEEHDRGLDPDSALEGPIRVPDLKARPRFPLRDLTVANGFNAALVIPLRGSGGTMGALILYRKAAEDFPSRSISVMQTFANQAVLAIQNARLFQEVIDKSRQLEIANAHRTQFFANMSHELRTPLNAVLGYSELLFDGLYGALPERALGVLERIQVNGKHLLGLINDILDMTKMEAGALTLALTDYSMEGLVDGVMGIVESLAKTKGIDFRAEVPPGLPVGRGDDKRLTQVLLNLVGNAIKFTDHGEVRVEVAQVDKTFHVSVHDTGPGIAPENLERIFDEFQQVDDADTRKKGGTGLGLSISRRLVDMHGGTMRVQSTRDAGSIFTMIIPIRVEEQRPVQ